MKSYYGKKVPGQFQGVLTRPSVGLNNYTPSVNISDNHLSDMLDAKSFKDSAMELSVKSSMDNGIFYGKDYTTGMLLEAIAIQGKSTLGVSEEGYALLVYSKDTEWYVRKANDKTATVEQYEVTSGVLPIPDPPTYVPEMRSFNYSSCNFHTEAISYVCFSCDQSKYLIAFDYVNKKLINIALPFYPKKIVAHASRIFCMDTNNAIWWCRAGDIYSWYSIEYTDDMLKASGDMANGEYILTGEIDVTRPITFTVTKVGTLDTLGSALVDGTNILDQAQVETAILKEGRVQTTKSYKTINAITQSGWATNTGTDQIQIGVAPVSGGYVTDDAGYWTIEKEKSLTNICVMSNNLFIFAPDNIYVFRGYSPETFTLNQVVVDMGIKQPDTPREWLVTIDNNSYFYNNKKIYEFNGYDYPKEVSHLIYINGALTNGIMGGIEDLDTEFSLVADSEKLYIYDSTSKQHDNNYIYVFDTKYRTWWKRSGFSKNNSVYVDANFYMKYITMASSDSIVSFVSLETSAGLIDMHYDIGHKGNYDPFIVTKAFNTNPSELGTLTAIILQIQGTIDSTSNISLLYSITMDGDDFTEFKSFTPYTFNGDVENISIPVPIAYIANANHYRLKLISSGTMLVYNIERRFRVKGYSR